MRNGTVRAAATAFVRSALPAQPITSRNRVIVSIPSATSGCGPR